MMHAGLHAIARSLMTPARRRPPRTSHVVWERREDVPTRVGPVVAWSTGAGPIALLVHGWDADHTDMDAFVAPLVRAGRRVVAFDFPAHGESAGDSASLFDLGSALEDVATHLGPIDAIVAHSAGCAAAAIACQAGLRVRRAAFVAPPIRYEDFVRYSATMLGEDPDALVASFRELGYEIGDLDIRKNAVSVDGIPLLILHSRDDRVCDARNATAIAAVWKDATVDFVDGLGHTRILRDADVVRGIVAYVGTP
jgi:pimeloyl-ACP methyl ester carboxylesterase